MMSDLMIPFTANLSVKHVLKRSCDLPDPAKYRAHGSRTAFTFTGSTALSLAARGLKRTGRAHLLAPSFHCGHEIEPFFRSNFKIDLYRVNKDGKIDINHLGSLLQGSQQVVLVTHYFGFPQKVSEISDMCRSKGVGLVEDCAHSFQSEIAGRPLGSWGDIVIFSYRKTLPLPDGGAISINNPEIPLILPLHKPPFFMILRRTLKLLSDRLVTGHDGNFQPCHNALRGIKRIVSHLESFACTKQNGRDVHFYSPDDPSFNYDSQVLDWQMSKISLNIMNNLELDKIFETRRTNYTYIETALAGMKYLRPMFDGLPEGVCPHSFPLMAQGESERVKRVMRDYPFLFRFWPDVYPSVNLEPFPQSSRLKENCFVIPIHQSMQRRHLDYFIEYALKADGQLGK